MTDNSNDSTKVEEVKPKAEQVTQDAGSEKAFSPEELDALIAKEDPSFAEVIGGIGTNEEMQKGVNGEFSAEATLADEVALWKHTGGVEICII